MTTSEMIPSLSIVNGIPTVSSLDLAKSFDKRHDHLIRSIQSVVRNAPESFSAPNFGAAEYTDSQGKPRIFYHLTRDGFAFIAMGFTGKKAIVWKIAYIEAFNSMEQQLMGRPATPTDEPHAIPRLTTGAERKPLAVAVNKIIGMDGEGPTRQKYMAFWRSLNAVLGICHIRELTIDRLAAVQTLLEIIATLVTEPESPKLPGALPADYEAMPMADKVNALLDAFERTVEYSQQSTFAIETKLMAIIKTVDIGPGMDHVQGMNVRQMVNDLRIGFVHAMSNVQSSLNTIRPMFWMMSAASKLGQRLNAALPSGRGRPRKALTA